MASSQVIGIVIALDIIAFALAIAAEQRKNEAQLLQDPDQKYRYCAYESDVATWYGVAAMLLLLGSQALVMAASRCLCCGRSLRPVGFRACAIFLFFACWLTFIMAEACLLAGSVKNAYHTKYTAKFNADNLSCKSIRKGVFGVAAAFTFFTSVLSVEYYMNYSKAVEREDYEKGSHIRMGSYS